MQGKSYTHLGWVAAAFFAGLFLFAGFQPSQEKTAVVDLNRAMAESKLGKKNQDDFRNALQSRQNLLDFLSNNRVATVEQATKLRAFALKDAPLTPQEKQEEERIKSEVQASLRAFDALNQKTTPPTDQDKIQLQEFAQRQRAMEQTVQTWGREFDSDLARRGNEARDAQIAAGKAALDAVAKKSGYTIVYLTDVAPYGANDLTADTIKEMDAKTN